MRCAEDWTAPKLRDSLCAQLRSENFLAVSEATLGRGRVDVLALRKTFMTFRPVIYEIKVSRGDFLQDVRAEKWRKYLPYGLVAFAVPDGLVAKDEIPKEAGLRVRFNSGWRWTKHGKFEEPRGPMRDELFTRLALCLGDQYYARGQIAGGWRDFNKYTAAADGRSKLAREVMDGLQNLERLRRDLGEYEERRKDALERCYEAETRARAAERELHPHRLRANA